jgi:hypothetical protein
MKKFIKTLIIFLLPIMVYWGVVVLVLEVSGELIRDEALLAYQDEKNGLVGFAYSNPTKHMKLVTAEHKQPKIISLGSSRVMQFRVFFFNDPELFYNAGGAGSKIKEFNTFIDTIQLENLKVLIIGLDQYFFNENWDNMTGLPRDYRKTSSIIEILKNPKIFDDLILKRKIEIKSLLSSKNIGLTAKTYNQGFRSDGSYFYGKIIHHPELAEDKNFQDTFERIRKKNRRFQGGQKVNPAAVKELDSFLQNCKKRNIHVIAFLPPYAHAVWNVLESQRNDYLYIFNLYEKLNPIFTSYAFDLFDFSDIASIGATDEETIDGFHGSEVAYLRILLEMGRNCKILKQYIDLDTLNNMLENAFSSREIKQETNRPL